MGGRGQWVDLAALGSSFPLHIAPDVACHLRELDEGLAVEKRQWEMLASHSTYFFSYFL